MTYFSIRNKYKVEYSGYEDASEELRSRLAEIIAKYVRNYLTGYSGHRPSFLKPTIFNYAVHQVLPNTKPTTAILTGSFDEVFTVIEVFLDEIRRINDRRQGEAIIDILGAFQHSGSVYQLNQETRRIELEPNEELAKQIKEMEKVLEPYADAYKTFFEAAGNLFGRKTKAGDIVRDIYVAAEMYLKAITGEAQYSNAVKKLASTGAINSEQRTVMEKLYAFRSNTKGTTHAGSSPEVNEKQALWFLDTMSAQLRHIDIQAKEIKI